MKQIGNMSRYGWMVREFWASTAMIGMRILAQAVLDATVEIMAVRIIMIKRSPTNGKFVMLFIDSPIHMSLPESLNP